MVAHCHHRSTQTHKRTRAMPGQNGGAGLSPEASCSSVLGRGDDVVDLEDHLHQLRRQHELLLLADQRLEDTLHAHVALATADAIHTEVGVALLDLARLHGRQRGDGAHAAVLRQCHGDIVQRIGEGVHGILLHARHLVGGLSHRERARDLRGSAAVHDAVVLDEVARHAHGVVQGALGLVDEHVVAAAHEHGDGTGVAALLDDQHALLGGAERQLLHAAGGAEVLRLQLSEARADASASGDGDELQLDAAHPAHGGQLVLQQQVVGLVVEAPLADD
mmetsp:Transcript_5057/g.10698  ORF Transcript_5057/g.10698 Transcript_5057/m.10698 type:complete len:277 (+) Transcript_5057:73-903(+)